MRKGRAILLKIKGFNEYTTVYKQPRKKDVHGQPFKDNFNKYENAGNLTSYQLKRLKSFIK